MLAQKIKEAKSTENGFSLLELVIAVGVLLVLASSGVVAIRGLDERAKQTSVDSAVKDVYNVAYSYLLDGNSKTKPKDAETSYNSSQAKTTSSGNRAITVKVYELGGNRIRVEGYYDGGRINASFETPVNGDAGGSGGSSGGGVIVPTIEDTVSQFTYQCDKTLSGHLPIYNISDMTTVSLVGSDSSEKLVDYSAPDLKKIKSAWGSRIFSNVNGFDNVSEKLTMKAGVTYTVKVYGKFDNLSAVNEWEPGTATGANISFNECLISVDKLGIDSGIMTMNWFGGAKLTSMPKELPSTVTDLSFAFRATPIFNDPNISNWDTSNVTTLYYTFSNSYLFNQPLNWDVSNVSSLAAAFVNARAFNQPLLWDTSSVQYMGSMFSGASAFNKNISERTVNGVLYWDTSKVRTMNNVFANAKAFNNGQSAGSAATSFLWDTARADNMAKMFLGATSFNSNISRTTGSAHWDTRNVTTMSEMFYNASSYNRPMANWFMDKVTNTSRMFKNATKFNQNIQAKDSHNYWNLSSMIDMSEMFYGATAFNQDISAWDTSNVTTMAGVFKSATAFNNGTTSGSLSSDSSNRLSWNTSNVETMESMFENATGFQTRIGSVSGFWNVSNVKNMSKMFKGATSFNIALSSWNVSNVTDMSQMFMNATKVNTNLSTWKVANVSNYSDFNTGGRITSSNLPKF